MSATTLMSLVNQMCKEFENLIIDLTGLALTGVLESIDAAEKHKEYDQHRYSINKSKMRGTLRKVQNFIQ